MKRIFFLVLLAIGLWWVWHTPAARWRGMPAASEPVQGDKNLPPPFRHESYTLTPLASYSIKAVVLSRCRYRFDPIAKLCPLDLALGWGPMSVAEVINELSISQSGRWYEFSFRQEPPLEPRTIETHSANTHCIPANDQVRQQLLSIRRYDLVTLDGYLVAVDGSDGGHWRSSLTREDTRGGSCEVMWVTRVEHRRLQ